MFEALKKRTYDDFLKEVSILSDEVTLAYREAREGIVHDFSDMPGAVGQLCEAAKSLSTEERKAIRPKIVGLIDDLDHLASVFTDQFEEVRGNLKESSARHTAARAYNKPNQPHR